MTLSIQWPALAALAASLTVAQGLLFVLARGLSCRVSWKAAVLCNALAVVAVAPWLVRDRLMVPLDETILRNVPGTPAVTDADPHGIYNDVILQLLPWEMEVRRAFRGGRLPLWSDLLDGGSSPWVNPQAGVLSPVASLTRWAPLEHALLVALALKILIACQGAWLLGRRLGAGRTAAALGACGAGLGGAIFPWGLFPLSSAAAFVPWVVLAAILLARRPTLQRSAGGAAVFACLLLSGHPEVALAGTLLAAVCALGLKRRRTPWRRVIAGTAAGLLLGAGLAAPQLLPFLHILPETQRALRTLGKEQPPAPTEQTPAEWFPGTAEQILLAPVNPWAFGHPFRETYTGPINWPVTGAGYAGLLAFAGVAAALLARRCRRRALPFLAFAGPSLLLAAAFQPFVRAVRIVPFLGAVAFDRFLPVAALALALAGALGLGEILRRRDGRRRAATDLLLWAGPALAAMASLAVRHDRRLLVLWALILGGLGGLLLLRRRLESRGATGPHPLSPSPATPPTRPGRGGTQSEPAHYAVRTRQLEEAKETMPLRRLTAPLSRRFGRADGRGAGGEGLAVTVLACALLADLLSWGWDFLPTGHRELFYPRTPFVAAAAAEAGKDGLWRATAEGFLFYPSLFPVYGTAELRPHNPVALGRQLAVLEKVFAFQPEGRRYKSAFHNADHPLLDFLNVRVLISRENLPDHGRFERIDGGRFAPMRLYRNPDALPRLFLPVAARVRPRSAALDAVAALDNPRRVILLAEEVGGWRPPERRPWDPAAVRILAWRPGRIEVEVPAAGEKLLAGSLPFPAGWEARSAGSSTGEAALRKLTVNTAFLGVVVPDGVSRIELRFVPPGLRAGLALGLASLAVVIGIYVLPPRRRAKKDPAR